MRRILITKTAIYLTLLLLLSAAVCGCVSESGGASGGTGSGSGGTGGSGNSDGSGSSGISDGSGTAADTNPDRNGNAGATGGKGGAVGTDQNGGTTADIGAIIIERSGVIKKHAFAITRDNIICENIISPSILKDDGLYPMIDFEMSLITISPNHETPMHLLKGTSESMFILSGNADMLINGRFMTAEQGNLVHVPKNTPMIVRNGGRSDLKYLSITYPPYSPENEILDSDSEFNKLRADSEDATAIIVSEVTPEVFFKDVTVANLINPKIIKDYNQNYSIGCGIAYITIPEGSQTEPHIVEGTTEVDHILKGKGEFAVNSRIMAFDEGDTLYIQSGAHQSITNTGDGDLVYLSITCPPYDPGVDSSVKSK